MLLKTSHAKAHLVLLLLIHLLGPSLEAPSKGYFAPADRDPDHIQRIKNGDSSTEVEILYADGRLVVIACASLLE